MKTLKYTGLILIALGFLLTSCKEKDPCAVVCPELHSSGVIINQNCECECKSPSQNILVSGPLWNLCHFEIGPHYALRLEEYGKLGCDQIEIMFLIINKSYEPFYYFLTPPYSIDDIKEDALRFSINIYTGEKNYPDALSCVAVTQNEGDRSELLIYSTKGMKDATSGEEVGPIYLPNCEEALPPARAKAYLNDELFSIHFFFYADEETFFSDPDQYLYSEVLNFDRKYIQDEFDE